MSQEEWRWAVGYEGDYEVSSLGRVRSWVPRAGKEHVTKPRIRKLIPNKGNGYLEVMFVQRKRFPRLKMAKVHVLVLEAFIGPRLPGTVARHVNDRDLTNNCADNLLWGTQVQNMQDALRHGTDTRGERNGRAKLTQLESNEIRKRLQNGERGKDLASVFGVWQSTITNIKYNRSYVL